MGILHDMVIQLQQEEIMTIIADLADFDKDSL